MSARRAQAGWGQADARTCARHNFVSPLLVGGAKRRHESRAPVVRNHLAHAPRGDGVQLCVSMHVHCEACAAMHGTRACLRACTHVRARRHAPSSGSTPSRSSSSAMPLGSLSSWGSLTSRTLGVSSESLPGAPARGVKARQRDAAAPRHDPAASALRARHDRVFASHELGRDAPGSRVGGPGASGWATTARLGMHAATRGRGVLTVHGRCFT